MRSGKPGLDPVHAHRPGRGRLERIVGCCDVAAEPVFDGSITRLPPTTIPTGTNAADVDKSTVVSINDPAKASKLELGDLVKTIVTVTKKDDALWLPPQAIRTFEGRKFVVIKEGAGQRRVDVKTGIESVDRVEILDGLTAGQQVLGQ